MLFSIKSPFSFHSDFATIRSGGRNEVQVAQYAASVDILGLADFMFPILISQDAPSCLLEAI